MTEESIFSKIVAGEVPAQVVDETDESLAFLDANPLARGHTLVIPKEQYERVDDMPADVAREVFATIHRVAPAVESAVDAAGTTIAFNDGEAAGQEVPHVHGHVVPRFDDDGIGAIHSLRWPRPDLAEDEFEQIGDDIAEAVGRD